jgi:TRAP-type C4-dicarboxylate transport system permease small subunit
MGLLGAQHAGFTLSVRARRRHAHHRLPLAVAPAGDQASSLYGVFIGMAAATRRLDHLFLSEITKRLPTGARTTLEIFNRLVVLAVAIFMVWFGYKNFLLDLGSFRMPSMIPLGTYTIIVPLSGVLIALFAVEQAVNGWRNGFAGPEDRDDQPRVIA